MQWWGGGETENYKGQTLTIHPLKDTPLQKDNRNFLRIHPPPSKPEKWFEGGPFLVIYPDFIHFEKYQSIVNIAAGQHVFMDAAVVQAEEEAFVYPR